MEPKIAVKRFSDSFKSEVLEFSKENSNIATGRKFNISKSVVHEWRKKANMESKQKHVKKQYSEKFKSEILEFSKENSHSKTVRKFNVPQSTIIEWRKKANMEFKVPVKRYSAKFKLEVLEFSKENTLEETERMFDVNIGTVWKWKKKANIENKHLRTRYSDEFKSEVLQFYKANSLKETIRNFHVNKTTVWKWKKEATMKSKLAVNTEYSEEKSEVLEEPVSVPCLTSLKVETMKPVTEKLLIKEDRTELGLMLAQDYFQTKSWNESCSKFSVPVGSRRHWYRKLFGGYVPNNQKRISAACVNLPDDSANVTDTLEQNLVTLFEGKEKITEVAADNSEPI